MKRLQPKHTKKHIHRFLPPGGLDYEWCPALRILTVRCRNLQVNPLHRTLFNNLQRYNRVFLYSLWSLDELGDHANENMPVNMAVAITRQYYQYNRNVQEPSSRIIGSELKNREPSPIHHNDIALDGILDVWISGSGIVRFVSSAAVYNFRSVTVNMDLY